MKVVRNLQELFGEMYTLRNVIITGTHTHSAPGGHLVDFLLDVSILGFSRETYNAYVDGITRVSCLKVLPYCVTKGQSRTVVRSLLREFALQTQLDKEYYNYISGIRCNSLKYFVFSIRVRRELIIKMQNEAKSF